MTNEPVALSGALHSLVVALIGLANLFGWTHWTTDQTGAVLTAYAAFMGALTVVVRSRVAPHPAAPPLP